MSKSITLADLTLNPDVQGPIWSHRGAQLDVNILYFDGSEGVAEHINPTLDVWLVVMQGRGEATIEGVVHTLTAGTCLYIPAGAARSLYATGTPLVFASAHQRRPGLMPQ